jgi:S1-C subfamily serine protease
MTKATMMEQNERDGDQQLPEYVSPWESRPADDGYSSAGEYGSPGGNEPADGYGPAGESGGSAGQYGPPGGYGPPAGYGVPPGTYPLPGTPEPPRRRGHGGLLAFLLVFLVAAGAGAGTVVALNHSSNPGTTTGTGTGKGVSPGDVPNPRNNAAPAGSSSLNTQAVANEVEPGVVDISAPVKYSNLVSAGTGMVLSSDGLVLTNNHVIDGATSPTVTLVSSGRTYPARILGYDSTHDVALLQLQGASGLKTVSVGNSSQVKSGDAVLAIGNAQGQGGPPTVAPGQVTALDQTISPSDQATGTTETLHGTIETNAQIQEGDSGGPLANSAGQVIGMDTAASSSQSLGGTSATAGFAIPINQALSIARQIAGGHASTTVHIGLPAFIGIEVADASTGCQSSGGGFGSGSGSGSASSGALICQVYQGTPGASSGLAAGDVITAANGQAVATANSLISITSKFQPGATLSVTYTDTNGASHTARVTLASGPAK